MSSYTTLRPLFIASIGNPAPYLYTRHSAGHILLSALLAHTSSSRLIVDQTYAKGAVATNNVERTVFWRSPTSMNVSGPAVQTAWRSFCHHRYNIRDFSVLREKFKDTPTELPLLVVLHDELELALGKYSMRYKKGASARGHNGVKSILSMRELADMAYLNVGIGIGPRPRSRDPDVVADFVLGQMNDWEMDKIRSLAKEVWENIQPKRLK